jgi:hypothetical protein
MMKAVFIAIGITSFAIGSTLFAPSASGQKTQQSLASSPFALKGDLLGETLQGFRIRNERTVRTPQNSKVAKSFHLPVCTNDRVGGHTLSDYDIDEMGQTPEETRAGIVKCRAALNRTENSDLFINNGLDVLQDFPRFDESSIAGAGAYQTIYYFFHDQLYKIQSELPAEEYANIRAAFVAKYGPPVVTIQRYQNSFGATVEGEQLLWSNSSSHIGIGQLDGTNVRDWTRNQVRIVYWHDSIDKECETAGAAKDRTKDM